MQFNIVSRGQRFPDAGRSQAFLRIDAWNDYSFVTMFDVLLFDENGERFDLGSVKIGFVDQTTATSTASTLVSPFASLPSPYFSVGQDVAYYQSLSNLTEITRQDYLLSLRDVVADQIILDHAKGQEVFRTSLLRSVSVTAIEGQFRRVLDGGVPLTDFDFDFSQPGSDKTAAIDLQFVVNAGSVPSTNIHALIGRNGVGKTTLLNEMIAAIRRPDTTSARFRTGRMFSHDPISSDYFSALVSVAFSAFDPFAPPPENVDPGLGTRYSYIGLKDIEDDTGTLLKSLATLREECVASVAECISDVGRRGRWQTAIKTLESDENFARMNLSRLVELRESLLSEAAARLVERMSSGHAVVLLTISRLVARVEEKTLVLLDEPESHLHPPLLSAFTRALSELLHNRNGVAIVATHSPVLLQEVPRSCVHVMTRLRLSMHAERPRLETFGENVGSLTREVFGLEVSESGFHALLRAAVAQGSSYDAIVASYDGQLGQEGRGMLRAMVADRDEAKGIL
ncbi:MAG: ATP-binding cassette domain-containing protein [Sphingobium sp.]|nr:MAG: ATP-binding cassette domain-containing protein [Sphingobium sp.]